MTDRITLTGLRARGFHGVLPEERSDGQEFVVDVLLSVDTRFAAADDDLSQTVDYADVARAVVTAVESEPVNLIETLAARVADTCVARTGVTEVTVTVHKPQAPVGVPFGDVMVTITRSSVRVRPAILSLGANLGDRAATLQGAVRALAAQPGLRIVEVSTVYETDPVGGPQQSPYLNAVLRCETTLTGEALLAAVHRVEAAYGRVRDVRWGARTLDVDVITVGDEVRRSARLTLPHARAHERAFVLLPWLEVEPDGSLPGHGSIAALAETVGTIGVRPVDQVSLEIP